MSETFGTKQESKSAKLERLATEHRERQRMSICERLLLPSETVWEEIEARYSSSLISVLSGEAHFGTTVQNRNVERSYMEALEKLKSEPRLDALPYVEKISEVLSQYDAEKIEALRNINTKDDALKSELRRQAKIDRDIVARRLKDAELFTDIDATRLAEFYSAKRILQIAVGSLNGEECRHDDVPLT